VLVFPVVWVAYTMVRGAFVYWYPYFFLDPTLVAVPFEYALYLIVIVAIFTGITAFLITISRVPPLERLRERLGRDSSYRLRWRRGR
jgi:ABC-type antimicrobial peptide transport system permease subunit